MTPRRAIEVIAAMVKATVIEQENGTLLIRSNPELIAPKVPTPDAPPETEQTTGRFILITPRR